LEVIVARDDGKRGGRVCEEEGSRRGVDIFEFSVEGGKTRFARRKLKNAAGKLTLAGGVRHSSCTKSYSDEAADERIPKRRKIIVREQEGTEYLFYPL
jgi:hypothetical protein